MQLPRGGPRPQNTLSVSWNGSGGDHDQRSRNRHHNRNFGTGELPYNISYGNNLSHHQSHVRGARNGPAPSDLHPHKRRKTEHPTNSAVYPTDSSSPIEELPPKDVEFGNWSSRRNAPLTKTMNFQNRRRENGFANLNHVHNVERMMSSSGKSNQAFRPYNGIDSPSGLPRRRNSSELATGVNHASKSALLKGRLPNKDLHAGRRKVSHNFGDRDKKGSKLDPSPATIQSRSHTDSDEANHGQKLSSQFRAKLRGQDQEPQDDLSTDELEEPAPVLRVSPSRNRRKSSPMKTSTSSNACMPARQDIEPSIIVPTTFQKKGTRSRKKAHDSFVSDIEEDQPMSWRAVVKAINIPGKSEITPLSNTYLVQGLDRETFWFVENGVQLHFTPYMDTIQSRKLFSCLWEENGGKIRLQSSKCGSMDNVLEFEFASHKKLTELIEKTEKHLQSIQSTPQDKMAKIFAKSRIEPRNPRSTNDVDDALENMQPIASNQERNSRAIHGSTRSEKPNDRTSKLVSDLMRQAGEDYQRTRSDDNVAGVQKHNLPEESTSKPTEKSIWRNPEHNNHLRRSTRNSGNHADPPTRSVNQPEVEEFQRFSKIHGLGTRWSRPLTFPRDGKKKATIEFDDLERLDDGQFLNDNLIGFYLRYLEYEIEQKRPELMSKIYIFNSYFYERLTSLKKGQKGINYEGVSKWTRAVDLFTYDYIVVPINELAHWYAAIICNLPALKRRLAASEEPQELLQAETKNPVGLAERDAAESFAEMSLESRMDDVQCTNDNLANQTEDENERRSDKGSHFDEDVMLDQPQDFGPFSPEPQPQATDLTLQDDDVQEAAGELALGNRKANIKKKSQARKGPITNRNPDLPAIITFDSFGNAHGATVKALKQYLVEEARAKRGGMEFVETDIKGITAKGIPLQNNFSDCGLFMLGYIEKFLSGDPRSFITMIVKHGFDVMNDWPKMVPKEMRTRMREQLQELYSDQQDHRRGLAKRYNKYSPGSRHVQENGQEQREVEHQRRSAEPTPKQASAASRTSALKEALSLGEEASQRGPVSKSSMDAADDSVIVLDSESLPKAPPQQMQLPVSPQEEPPSSQPPGASSPIHQAVEMEKSKSRIPAEIPESQLKEQTRNLPCPKATASDQASMPHSQGAHEPQMKDESHSWPAQPDSSGLTSVQKKRRRSQLPSSDQDVHAKRNFSIASAVVVIE